MQQKAGRPRRGDDPQKLTIHIGRKSKKTLYRKASAAGLSMGQFVEQLIARDEAQIAEAAK